MIKEVDLISIIIPVYNTQKYLKRCWNSLKNQTYKNLEFIFVDDCSTDNSYEFLKEISLKDSRVVLIKNKENSGVSYSRNQGISIANGKYIGFVDSDDYCEKDMFQSMYNAIIKEKADICCCGLNIVQNEKVKRKMWKYSGDENWTSIEAIKLWLTAKYIGNSVYTKLFKKTLWEDVEFPIGETFEEAYVIPKLFLKAKKIVHNNQQSYNYYMNESSLTHQKFSNNSGIIYQREEYLFDLLNDYDVKEELDAFVCRINTNLYKGALRNKKNISQDEFKRMKEKFNDIYFKGLFNKKVSLKDKIKIMEVKIGIGL